jgi:hypothetical protein
MKINEFSFKVILFIFIVFSINFYEKIEKVVDNSNQCICSYDGFGYYMYNPFLFSKGSLNLNSDWAKEIQNKYCDSTIVYQFHTAGNGKELNIYHMGLAIVQLPSFLLGDVTALFLGFERDGFSKTYHLFYLVNALIFILLGLLYLKKLLRLFFDDRTTGLTILMIYLGTNALATFGIQYDLTHLYLFALNSIFLYHLFKYQQTDRKRSLILSAVFLGLTACIRPTQVLFGIIPLFIILNNHQGNKFIALKKLLWFPLFGIIWNLPQIYYWHSLGGHFLSPNMHTEEIIIIDPNIIDFLFSYKKGWLLYSPLFLILPIGFYQLFKFNRNLSWSIITFTSSYILIMSSWECWWYAFSFGSRVMTDIYPLLAIVIGFTILAATKMKYKIGFFAFITFCIGLSLFQSFQSIEYIIHPERMTKEQYWHVFGKTEISDAYRLEIDRENTDWTDFLDGYQKRGINHKNKIIYSFKKPKTATPGQDLSIEKFRLLEKVPNDETCFLVSFKAMTSDSTISSLLRMETVSKYNCYGWNNYEISLGKTQNQYNDYFVEFNLKNIRHSADQMQIYIDNDNDVEVKIKDFEITAITLIRN